jgi:hypothetical protein
LENSEPETRGETMAVPASAPGSGGAIGAYPAAQNTAAQGCGSCGAVPAGSLPAPSFNRGTPVSPSWIYAIGKIEPRFPRVSAEKEFAQAMAGVATAGLTDRQALHGVLSAPENRYLARQLCWVLTISGVETYLIVPRLPEDLHLLVAAVRPTAEPGSLDAVIGTKGPVAPPDMCNGLSLPVVAFDQLYSFDRESLLKSIPAPHKSKSAEFAATAAEVLDRILAATDNAGATDEHRALNYLALRYPGIYATAADAHARDLALTSIQGQPWRLSVARRVTEVRFTFTQRKNEFVEKYFARVDVNDEFPFLVSKMAPYWDH